MLNMLTIDIGVWVVNQERQLLQLATLKGFTLSNTCEKNKSGFIIMERVEEVGD